MFFPKIFGAANLQNNLEITKDLRLFESFTRHCNCQIFIIFEYD